MIKRMLFWLLLAIVIVLASVGYQAYQQLQSPMPVEAPRLIEVQKGEVVGHILTDLHQSDLIQATWPFKVWVRVHPELSQVKAGLYELEPNMTALAFLQRVVQGNEKQFSITLIEGMQWRQWKSQLLTHPNLDSDGFDESALIQRWALQGNSLEGWLMPDTYHFSHNTSVETLVKLAHERLTTALNETWQNRQFDLPLSSPYEALILASIIEKETGLAEERPTIAGVFVNRLRKGMRLQTDPTVIYGMGEAFDGNIRRADLRRKTPYNTYVINGLPPTPIAMVGEAALKASMNPAETDALYFVSRNDGSHVFSTNLADHNRAVRRYQLNQSPEKK